MSSRGTHISCRRCNETFPIEDENCPHCGKPIRRTAYLAVAGVVGLILVVASLFNLSELAFFGVVGALLVGSSVYLLYSKRQRIKDASEISAENTQAVVENT